MDARRYHQARERNQPEVALSGSTFPGIVTIAVGVIIIVVGIILLAAYGVPRELPSNLKTISGVLVLSIGIFIALIGIGVSIRLKKEVEQRKQQKKRTEQQGEIPRRQTSQQQRKHQQQQQQLHVNPRGYNGQGQGHNASHKQYYGDYNHHNNSNQYMSTDQYQPQRQSSTGGAVATVYS